MNDGQPDTAPRQQKVSERPRYAVQVVYASGDIAYLRHGATVGAGPIVQFRDRKTADVNMEFVGQGLKNGAKASVVRYRKEMEED